MIKLLQRDIVEVQRPLASLVNSVEVGRSEQSTNQQVQSSVAGGQLPVGTSHNHVNVIAICREKNSYKNAYIQKVYLVGSLLHQIETEAKYC